MLKKLSNTHLLIIFVVLVGIYILVNRSTDNNRSEDFREVLITFDTAAVDQVRLSKPVGVVTQLHKQNNSWFIKLNPTNNQLVPAMDDRVESMLQALLTIKPSRLITRDPEKWVEYQVDSTGTEVEVLADGEVQLRLVIGRLGMMGQNQYLTYVRLADEDEVYAAENFIGFSVPAEANNYRNQELVNLANDSVVSVTFAYGGDSIYTLALNEAKEWAIDNQMTDSSATSDFFSELEYASSTAFKNTMTASDLPKQPIAYIRVNLASLTEVQLSYYTMPDGSQIIHSSQNPENFFEDLTLVKRLFKAKSYFLPTN